MSETKSSLNNSPLRDKIFPIATLVVVVAVAIYFIVQNVGVFGNVLLVAIGFGAVILIHEFGHFIAAKLSGIKVDAFSIGFPPTVLGISRTDAGYRVRILPDFFKTDNPESSEGLFTFTIGKAATAGETEYRIGLIPFGGFVKMLGQEDAGAAKTTDDPRSFANKPIASRAFVIAMGVVFNAISAIAIFMVAFLIGIKLLPPIVGGVIPDSPAAVAGLKAGDEIIQIWQEKTHLDFSNIGIAAALSDANQAVPMKVKHPDGSVENFAIAAKKFPGKKLKIFGILQPISLTVARIADHNDFFDKTGLMPGDTIETVNGKEVKNYWGMDNIVKNSLNQTVTVTAKRSDKSGKDRLIESTLGLTLRAVDNYGIASKSNISHICSIVPRLRVDVNDVELGMQKGDIILAAADVENPTYNEMLDVVEKYAGKKLPIRILRTNANGAEETLSINTASKLTTDPSRVMLGIGTLDAEHPVVAKTIPCKDGLAALEIPSGATITAVDGVKVSNFYDIISQIHKNTGQNITIDYRLSDQVAGNVTVNVAAGENFITAKSTFADFVPFEDLKRLYKATGPIDAVVTGYKKTIMFIAQTYATLKSLVVGAVSPKELMGPLGIVTVSYRIVAEQPLVYYVYFLGLISACIAVFNFLPLPPLDGGLIALLLIEKIKGSALSERIQGIIAYTGWALIGTLFLYVTFNDVIRSFFG
jgi:regulator of sigma E protease